jgi:hypothetical protein
MSAPSCRNQTRYCTGTFKVLICRTVLPYHLLMMIMEMSQARKIFLRIVRSMGQMKRGYDMELTLCFDKAIWAGWL